MSRASRPCDKIECAIEPAIRGKTDSSFFEPTPVAPGAPKSTPFIAGFLISGVKPVAA
jgi:hypothetical protein